MTWKLVLNFYLNVTLNNWILMRSWISSWFYSQNKMFDNKFNLK